MKNKLLKEVPLPRDLVEVERGTKRGRRRAEVGQGMCQRTPARAVSRRRAAPSS